MDMDGWIDLVGVVRRHNVRKALYLGVIRVQFCLFDRFLTFNFFIVILS